MISPEEKQIAVYLNSRIIAEGYCLDHQSTLKQVHLPSEKSLVIPESHLDEIKKALQNAPTDVEIDGFKYALRILNDHGRKK